MTRNIVVTALIVLLMAAFVLAYRGRLPFTRAAVPPVKGYAEGQAVLFIHTEASDADVARKLSAMKGSPVFYIPSLARTPETALASVYVFSNGVKGEGPFGFQPDIFDDPPGTPGYSPLRALHLVAWKSPSAARLLKSAAEVKEAETKGEVTIQRPGVVINMPMLTWPGGQR